MIFSGKSDVGKRRTTNQDSYSILSLPGGYTLLTVCDGMGGVSGGNVASQTACAVFCTHVKERFDPAAGGFSALLKEAAAAANTAVYEKAQADPALKGMGTTLVSALISQERTALVLNVGDSRMYTFDGKELRQITRDHSYVQYLVDRGQITVKEAETASIRNIIIRSVGNEPETNPDLFRLELTPGSYVLLCSDGLTNCVKKDALAAALKGDGEEELEACTEELIRLANEGGGVDNITVILGKIS